LGNKKSNSGCTSICQYNRIHSAKIDKLINGCMNDGHTDSLMNEKGITVGDVIASKSLNAATLRQLLRLHHVACSLNITSQAFTFKIMNFSALLGPAILRAVHMFQLYLSPNTSKLRPLSTHRPHGFSALHLILHVP
jgi:hypothetical protein